MPTQCSTSRAAACPTPRARNLLTYAFGAEVIERIPVASLVTRLEQTVLAQTQAPTRATR